MMAHRRTKLWLVEFPADNVTLQMSEKNKGEKKEQAQTSFKPDAVE
jgi:hypothetical protein